MVNQQFTFAVHVMTLLAFSGEKMDSRTLATSINTNPVVVRRLLQALRGAGLVTTEAGRSGGSRLRKTPSRISLLEIYQAVQPHPVILPNERKVWRRCRVSCGMKQIMYSVAESAESAVRRRLRGIKLSTLVRQIR